MANQSPDMVNSFKPPGTLPFLMYVSSPNLSADTKNSMVLTYDDRHEHLLTDPSWHHIATYAAFPSRDM